MCCRKPKMVAKHFIELSNDKQSCGRSHSYCRARALPHAVMEHDKHDQ